MNKPQNNSFEEMQREIVAWANIVMPHRKAQDTFNKLVFEEIPELVKGGFNDPMEYADILILVMDLAYLKGIDAAIAVREKMKINKKRRWKYNPINGMYNHIENNSQYTPTDQEDDGYTD